MNNFFHRFITALRVLFLSRVFVIEIVDDKKIGKDAISLIGTIQDPRYQIEILRALADSIEVDMKSKQDKTPNFKPLNN